MLKKLPQRGAVDAVRTVRLCGWTMTKTTSRSQESGIQVEEAGSGPARPEDTELDSISVYPVSYSVLFCCRLLNVRWYVSTKLKNVKQAIFVAGVRLPVPIL